MESEAKRFGVRGRLLLAFFGISAFAVLAAAAAMYSFLEVNQVMGRITQQRVPSALASLELAGQAQRIVSAAPVLLTVTNATQHQQLSASIAAEVDRLNQLLSELEARTIDPAALQGIELAVQRLGANLNALNQVVAGHLVAAEQKKQRLHRLSITDLATQRLVDPGLRVMDSEVSQLRRQINDPKLAVAQKTRIKADLSGLFLSLVPTQRVQSEAAALNDLLLRAAATENAAELPVLFFPLRRAISTLESLAEDLEPKLQKRLLQRVQEFRDLWNGANSLLEARKQELDLIARGEQLLSENAEVSQQLTTAVQQLVSEAKQDIRVGNLEASTVQRFSTIVLIVAVVLSLISSSLIVWLYVGRNLIARLTALSERMLAIARGDLETRLPADGKDEIGDMAKALAVFRDTAVEVKKTNLREIRELRNRLTDAIESISQGFALYDKEDRLLVCNSRYRDILCQGISNTRFEMDNLIVPKANFQALLRIGAEQGLYPDAVGRIQQWLEERMARHRQPLGPFEQPLCDGRWLQISEYKTQDGESVGIYTDITERKQVEEALRRQNEYLAALHDTALGLVSRLDLNELLHTLITRASQLLDVPYGFVYLAEPGASVAELKVVVGLSEQRFGERHSLGEGLAGQVWQTCRPLVVDDYDTWSKRSEDIGHGIIGAIVGVPLTHGVSEDQAGSEVVGVIGLAFPAGSQRTFGESEVEVLARFAQLASIALDNARLYAEAQNARETAELANQTKSDFLASVSHELRTPLTSVLGFAKITQQSLEKKLLPKIQVDDRRTQRDIRHVKENIEIIVAEGERLTTLINSVLDLAKIESGKVEWEMRPLSIVEVIERATTATQSLLEPKRLKLVKDIAADLPEIIGDRNQLIQVVINLISNAVKFTHKGSVTCRVRRWDNEMIISVIDTGLGILPDDQPKVFEKFKQVGDTLTDKPQGTGLGLPICKEIVDYHGGRIWVESKPGQSSTFSFALPIKRDNGDQDRIVPFSAIEGLLTNGSSISRGGV